VAFDDPRYFGLHLAERDGYYKHKKTELAAMPRVLRIAGSFAVVLTVFWTYKLVAVPWIEPPADPRANQKLSEEAKEAAENRLQRQVATLEGMFPDGAWELKEPKILESDRLKLLFQNYTDLGDGRVELRPCTMIFMPDDSVGDEAQRRRQAVILEVPDRAILEFDEALDLRRGKIGRLVGGQLAGRITIRGKGEKPGPEDDLLIVTQDVQLTERHVWTPHAVDFHWGPHYGRGKQMHITLLPGAESDSADRNGPKIAGIERFELRRVEQLHLELGENEWKADAEPLVAANGSPKPPEAPSPAEETPTRSPLADLAENLPVEVTCSGPFCFDAVRKVATFEDRVNVLRINPHGPCDQLNCELLTIFFIDRVKPKGVDPRNGDADAKDRPAGSFDLQPQRIEAAGHPVVFAAPSKDVHARGERLEYDFSDESIVLDGGREVMLRKGPSEIHARSLRYKSAGDGPLGQIAAAGPGWLRGERPERPGEPLSATWSEQLNVRPFEGNQVISLYGDAELTFREIGRLTAPEIHFYLLEVPDGDDPKKTELLPDRMLACQRAYRLVCRDGELIACRDERPLDPEAARSLPISPVEIDSPQFSGKVEQLGVWFQGISLSTDTTRKTTPAGEDRQSAGPAFVRRLPSTRLPPQETPPGPKQHFAITGRLLQAKLLLVDEDRPDLSELTVVGRVRFEETQTGQPDEAPLLLVGDQLHVTDAHTPEATMVLTGQPANFEGRGLALSGTNLQLNRGTNRMWIDGSGWMTVPIDRDLQNRPLPTPGILRIAWEDRMVFDGRVARFEEAVDARTTNGQLQTETLEVHFQQAVDFSSDKIRQQPELEQILCRGGVFMENRSFEGPVQTSHEQMQVVDLAIHRVTGAMTASGPGWLNSTHYGSQKMLGGRDEDSGGEESGNEDSGDQRRLQSLHVRFQGPITGNLHQREMTFHDRVHCAFSPVDSWGVALDPERPDSLGPRGAAMHCDRLTVAEMPVPGTGRNAFELEAGGNVVVESTDFTARAIRMTYAEAKGQLVLEGDGRTDAELFRQQQTGGPTSKFAARKIFYWPKTKKLKIDDGRSLQLSGLGGGGRAAW